MSKDLFSDKAKCFLKQPTRYTEKTLRWRKQIHRGLDCARKQVLQHKISKSVEQKSLLWGPKVNNPVCLEGFLSKLVGLQFFGLHLLLGGQHFLF